MKLIRLQTTFDVQDAPVYGTVQLATSSPGPLVSPDAFEFAKKQGGFLQSAGHAVIARVAFHKDNENTKQGLDCSDLYQKTSTLSLKFPGKKGLQAGFVELPNEEASYELVKEGYKENSAGRELIKPCNDAFVKQLIEQAQDTHRVVDVLKNNPLKLGTNKTRGKSEYGKHPYVIALFGDADIAELNASYIHEEGKIAEGFVWDVTERDLERILKEKADHVLISSVGLGGGGYDGINGVIAYGSYFYGSGRARGVVPSAQKI